MLKWIHQLLNPHCPDCKDEHDERSICKSCEVLKVQLEVANNEKHQLLAALLPKQKEEAHIEHVAPEPIKGRHVSFQVRRQMLEAEDRQQAALLAKKQKEIADVPKDESVKTSISVPIQSIDESIEGLEKELGVG